MRGLINISFTSGKRQFINVSKFGVEWTDDKNKFKASFDKGSVNLAINFLHDNSFLVLAICYSIIGIQWVLTQGYLHFIVSQVLYHFRNKWLSNTKKRDL